MRARSLIVLGLLMALAAPTAAGQTAEPSAQPTLNPEPMASASVAPSSSPEAVIDESPPVPEPSVTMLEFSSSVSAITRGNEFAVRSGAWRPFDPRTGRQLKLNKKKDARRAKSLAVQMAERLEALLLATTPDACSLDRYATLQELVPALRAYGDGIKGADKLVGAGMKDFSDTGQDAYQCAITAGQPDAVRNDRLIRAISMLPAEGYIKIVGKPGKERLKLTAKGRELSGGAELPEGPGTETEDFLISLLLAHEEAATE